MKIKIMKKLVVLFSLLLVFASCNKDNTKSGQQNSFNVPSWLVGEWCDSVGYEQGQCDNMPQYELTSDNFLLTIFGTENVNMKKLATEPGAIADETLSGNDYTMSVINGGSEVKLFFRKYSQDYIGYSNESFDQLITFRKE